MSVRTLRDAGRHIFLTVADLRRDYGITPADLNDRDRLPIGWLVAYLIGLSAESRLAGVLRAEYEATSGTGGVIGTSASGRPVVARAPGPRTVEPTPGALERGARLGLFEVID